MEPEDEMEPEFNADDEGGLDRYLQPGEELFISSENIGIKKFLFTACLTDRRLFLIDQKGACLGITAKEIPKEYIVESYLDTPPGTDPVLILSIKTADDETRTMKLGFQQSGEDRTPECEEWMVLFREGKRASMDIFTPGKTSEKEILRKPTAPTLVWPAEPAVQTGSKAEQIPPSAGTSAQANIPDRDAVSRGIPVEKGSKVVTPVVPVTRNRPEQTRNTIYEVLYCHHCGKKIPKNANFCPFCGTKTHDPETGGNPASQPNPNLPSAVIDTKPERRSFWKKVFGKGKS
jgi:hypothetical protein